VKALLTQQEPRHPVGVSEDSSRIIACLGAMAVIAIAGLLVPARDWLDTTNVALVLAIVVVGAAVFGGRMAGAITSISAALAFDFFHTPPYYDLRIDDRHDVIAALLLLVMGVTVGQLAALRYGSRHDALLHAQSAARLEAVASVVAAGVGLDTVWAVVRDALVDQLDLAACEFEPVPFGAEYATLGRDGQIEAPTLRYEHGGFSLPPEGVAVPVVAKGELLGRLVLVPRPHRGTSKPQRRVAVALADQLAVAAATWRPRQPLT
jgi:hypothetical protein